MKKFVKCINATSSFNSLIEGQVYEVSREDEYHIYLVNVDKRYPRDYGCGYLKHRFAPVSCPCNIKNCLTHRDK